MRATLWRGRLHNIQAQRAEATDKGCPYGCGIPGYKCHICSETRQNSAVERLNTMSLLSLWHPV